MSPVQSLEIAPPTKIFYTSVFQMTFVRHNTNSLQCHVANLAIVQRNGLTPSARDSVSIMNIYGYLAQGDQRETLPEDTIIIIDAVSVLVLNPTSMHCIATASHTNVCKRIVILLGA